MDLQFDLLQNSYDFMSISLDLYKSADKIDKGLKPRSAFEVQGGLKLAYVALLVATELLLKEAVSLVHPNLIYDDVDSPKATGDRLVTFEQAIARVNSLTDLSLAEHEQQFLLSCAAERTEFIHYKVTMGSGEIQVKYHKLHAIYRQVHKQLTGDEVEDVLEAQGEHAGGYRYFVNRQGERCERVKHGDKPGVASNPSNVAQWQRLFASFFEDCSGCGAARGQYHSYGCKLEACPFCGNEIASCDCIKYME